MRRDHCLSQPSTFIHAEMRAAAEGDPNLAQFAQFANDSLVAAQQAILAHAMQSHFKPGSSATVEVIEAL